MTKFEDVTVVHEDIFGDKYTPNPYGSKINGEWSEALTGIDYLQDNFGKYDTAKEMKENTNSKGYKKYFDWLAEKGKIPKE